ncbi:hypothetical protein LTR85_010360 [Meristemomyces frigidus]|nr:hypothetical protein LTR85_010360 [Meristemomyces frigidus]
MADRNHMRDERKRSGSPALAERSVRQKTEHNHRSSSYDTAGRHGKSLDAATDLALDHLLHDKDTHPLYQRNVNQVLDSFCSEAVLQQYMREPLIELMRHIDGKGSGRSRDWDAVRQRLVAGWTDRVIKTVGDSMCAAVDMAGDGVHVMKELDKARVELKVIPVVEVAESEAGEGAPEEQYEEEEEIADEEDENDGAGDEEDSAVDCTPGREDSLDDGCDQDEEDGDDSVGADRRDGAIHWECPGYDVTSAVTPFYRQLAEIPGRFDDDDRYFGFGARAAMALVSMHVLGRGGQLMRDMRDHFPQTRHLFQHHYLLHRVPFGRHYDLQVANVEARGEWDGLDHVAQHQWRRRHALLVAGNHEMLHLQNAVPEHLPESVASTAAQAQTVPLPGVRISHYKAVHLPKTVLLLREPQLQSDAFKGKKSHWLTVQEVRERVHIFSGNRPSSNLEVEAYTQGVWMIKFRHTEDARHASGKTVYIRNTAATLEPFRAKQSQIFLCKSAPRNLDVDRTLEDLLRALPDRKFHVQTRSASADKQHVLLTLDAPADIEAFQLVITLRGGIGWQARFNSLLRDERCVACNCGKLHAVQHCRKIRSVQPTGGRNPRLMIAPPIFVV